MSEQLLPYERIVANAIIAVDTVWGGDVQCKSGTGRVIADSYFSGKQLPEAYDLPGADQLRKTGGVGAKQPDKELIRAYIRDSNVDDYIEQMRSEANQFEPLRKKVVLGVADALSVQLDLARELIDEGPAVSYDRCVIAAMGTTASLADTTEDRARVRELLGQLGERVGSGENDLMEAVDSFRKKTWVGHEGIGPASDRVIAELDELVKQNFLPHVPEKLRAVPRSNVKFQIIEDAWFSGSMNYLGRERLPDGTPAYEAEYEINGKLDKSQAEFRHLVSHEVIPGHVTTFAYIQHLYHIGEAGFEATILTMNTRLSTLFEGIANAALLMAYGVRTIDDLPSPELQLGVTLSQLEDAAKNNASYFTYAEHLPADEIKRRLRQECLATPERSEKLTDAWAKHPLMGRAYMPSYRFGTDLVLSLLREHGPAKMIPILYGAEEVRDCVTVVE